MTSLTVQCVSCKKEMEPSAFCPHCGISQQCTQCETKFEGDEKFCGNCGAKRAGQTDASTQQQAEVASTTTEVSETVSNVAETVQQKAKKIPPFVWVIGVAIIAVIVYFGAFHSPSPQKAIEKNINSFFTAVEKKDIKSIQKFIHPEAYISEDFDELYLLEAMPYEIKIEIHRFSNWDIEENFAEVRVLATMTSDFDDEEYSEEFYVELVKLKNDWLIYDMY